MSHPHIDEPPSLAEFLAAPTELIRPLAPSTVLLALSGTRRRAALAGQRPHSEDYYRATIAAVLDTLQTLFDHGVRHIVAAGLVPGNLVEAAAWRQQYLRWVDWGLGGPEMLEQYRRRGWRVRALGAEDDPELAGLVERLAAAAPRGPAPTVWWGLNMRPEAEWERLLAAVQRSGARSRAAAIAALYGEDLEPAELFIAFGKPIVSPELFPPLLVGDVHCYWTQRPGYSLDAAVVRRILYDYRYLRPTGGDARAQRYDQIEDQRDLWESDRILGVGRRVGGFWTPDFHQPQPDGEH